MALKLMQEKPAELELGERQIQLAGEAEARFHGALTGKICEILEHADPCSETVDDLERNLRAAFEASVSTRVADASRDQLLLADSDAKKAIDLIMMLDERGVQKIIDDLEEVITRREQQSDYWPEGRMNLGIAYACLGDYEDARRWLEDAVNMLRYPSYIPRSEQMAE